MTISTIIQIVLFLLNFVFAKEIPEILYNLTDFTPKNTKIGNLIESTNQKSNILIEDVFLTNFVDYFDLKKNGDLFSKVDIDRDIICTKISCCKEMICLIKTKAHLILKTPISFNLTINIFDNNDNKPKFSSEINTVFIPESAELNSTLKLPEAVDIDSVENGIEGYQISEDTHTFKLQMISNEPYLRLMKHLDRETRNSYSLQLLVYGKGTPLFTSTLSLLVKVTDVNDNAPYFIQKFLNNTFVTLNPSATYSKNIYENQSGSQEIYSFLAQDNDEGENAKIVYSISSTLSRPSEIVQQKFSLESPYKAAKIQLRQWLDYENDIEKVIYVVIIAADSGKPAKSASITLTINVMDINDNPPVITERNPKDISENDSEKRTLKILSVTDKDLISTNKIQCQLMEQMKDKFELNNFDFNIYSLSNKVPFDYETRKEEKVRIMCIDKAEPERIEYTNFVVKIIDRNDNKPQWTKDIYHIKISEDDKPDQNIITVEAKDADSEIFGKLYYNITRSTIENTLHFIRINHLTGAIQMTSTIDREEFPQLRYDITVTDNADKVKDLSSSVIQHSNKTEIIIDIIDINDNFPEFISKETYFRISEDSPLNTKIGNLIFRDKDESPGNRITLYLLDTNHFTKTNDWFGITENGTIVVKNKLDREEINNVTLIVQAVDHGHPTRTSSVKIVIELLDVNDNVPSLDTPLNNTFISGGVILESAGQNTRLIELKARDLDVGYNASIFYKLMQTNLTNQKDDVFIKIDENTGEISTTWGRLNFPNVGVYFILVSISDKGIPPLSTHVRLYLNITSNNFLPAEAYMSNIVILILIIVCSLALIVSLIAAIFWVRFRVSNDSPNVCQEEYFEREHLNKEMNSNQYSLINLDKTFRQNSYDNNRQNSYETYQGFHHDSYVPNRNHTNYSHNTIHDVLDKSRMTPCEDCLTVYGTVPAQFNRFDTNLSRLRHPIIPDLNTTFSGNIMSANPKNFILQSYCESDYKTVSNTQPPTLLVEPNFSDSGKGGSVEDLNYRQYTGISTFTNSSFINTSSANAKIFCQNPNVETNISQCLYDKSSETMF